MKTNEKKKSQGATKTDDHASKWSEFCYIKIIYNCVLSASKATHVN